MRFLLRHTKKIALLFTLLFACEFIIPNIAFGLTSGPSQPEMKGFEPIGNSDMVDLFSGDFSYNIPLMDVGGYPINLAYHSGAGMDDEASWVGYGWSLNTGSVNRQLRGLPDDFNGVDKVERVMNMKDHVTKGGSFSMTLDLLGIPMNKIKFKKKKRKLNLSLTLKVGIKFDNYRGVGMELGANTGLAMTDYLAGDKTNSKPDTNLQSQGLASAGLTLSSMDGASVGVNSSIITNKLLQDEKMGYARSIGFGYNTRAGLTHLTLGWGKDPALKFGEKSIVRSLSVPGMGTSSISFAGDTYSPTIDHPKKSNSYTFSLHLGPELWVGFPGIGVTGFYAKQKVAETNRSKPAYGYLNSEKGMANSNDAIMDFNREKDIPYMSAVKYLPIPVPTYDLFTATSQDGSGQYRAYRGSSGVFFDNLTETKSDNYTVGVEFGAGFFADAGADLYKQDIKTKTRKWIDRNNFLPKGDFQTASSSSSLYESVYFKRVGEPVPYDKDYVTKIKGTDPVAVNLPGKLSNAVAGAEASDKLRTKASPDGESISVLKRDKRETRNTTFSYLKAKEAANHGLDKTIKSIHPDSLALSGCTSGGITNIARVGSYRGADQISEIIITGDDGKRSVYGHPVYNTYQEEVSFSTNQPLSGGTKGLTSYSNGSDNSINNNKGLENYFSKEITPPYATSYLLTAILSPDYVDRTGDGVTDDDLGTAIKFNYTKLNSLYHWRTPIAFGQDSANYNEGFLSDNLDNKANYSYGQKETWYLHSIESKTMVAKFIFENRKDALGVLNDRGAIDTTNKLKALKEIRLYSIEDLKKHGNNPALATPIKVAHFVYDYSLCNGLPNSIGNKGKLTLRQVYFTFGHNEKGKLNPYEFYYDTTNFNFYKYRQYDRWGNFKNAASNPNSLDNSEFPYVLQDTALANSFSSVGQLMKIVLPSGGGINIKYESDDYAYVQDKRASQMCFFNGVNSQGSSTNLINADYIYINLPYAVSTQQEMLERYFEGINTLYFKCFLNLDGLGHSEYVPGYAKISGTPERISSTIARIKLAKVDGINPIARTGWQFMRMNLPKYAYPGSENLESNQSDLAKAIKALVTAFGTIKELIYGFDKRAKARGFSNNINLQKSWVRLCSPTKKKLGGGSRVRRIDISDDWQFMSGTSGAQTATYSQLYDYTTKDGNGELISSGVASYEPMIGNDENPFRQPVSYKQGQFLGLDNYYYIEQPFGESFFPAPVVGYSKVSVKAIGTGDAETVNRTGWVVNEFFTAKDYPTKVDILNLQARKPATDKIFKLIGGISYDMVGLSQGYSIELNDMHGKPKSTQVLNKSGQNISSVEYFYKTVNELAEKKELFNTVKVIDPTGTVSDGSIGMDVETYTDMRQQTTENLGISVKVSGGSGAILIFPLPFFFPGIGVNYDKRSYRASSTVKIVNRFAIQYKVRKMENGSTISTESLLWDAETGNVLLSKTQNEFDDPIYSFAYPAHWVYEGMGQAYQNLGTVLSNFSTGSNGTISNSAYNSLLFPGDELIDVDSAYKYWVINSPVSSVYAKRIIDASGVIQSLSNKTLKLIRSGRRNMANTAIATIASLNNPIVGDKLDISQLIKILDAKATVFNEEWSVPVPSVEEPFGSHCFTVDGDCYISLGEALLEYNAGIGKPSIYATAEDSLTLEEIYQNYFGNSFPFCTGSFSNYVWNGQDSVPFYQYDIDGSGPYTISSGDTAQFGNCIIVFDSVTSRFNTIANTGNGDSLLALLGDFSGAANNSSCNLVFVENFSCDSLFNCSGDTVMRFRIVCIGPGCADPLGEIFNPYYTGIRGIWRPQSEHAYHVSRENFKANPAVASSTDIRRSGAYSLFNPFWKYNTSTHIWDKNPANDIRWITANEMTYFNSKGHEVENKDALDRYSSALFGYRESLPVAMASNTRYRELAYDGFEDYGFTSGCEADTCNSAGHFKFKKLLNGNSIDTTSLYSHTGKYSLKLSDPVSMVKTIYITPPSQLFSFDNSGQYVLESNELAKGFLPIPGKKYVLSFWLKDTARRNPATYMQASVNGTNLLNSYIKWPVVEDWKRVEVQFTLSSVVTGFLLQLDPGNSTVYIDDIRIHPFEGQMKSFAYDASSLRLMAELDENNFATFFEYDDEGIMVRMKKETERGILTLKETRSSYRKRH